MAQPHGKSSSLGRSTYENLCFISFCCVLSSAKTRHPQKCVTSGGRGWFESGKQAKHNQFHAARGRGRAGVDFRFSGKIPPSATKSERAGTRANVPGRFRKSIPEFGSVFMLGRPFSTSVLCSADCGRHDKLIQIFFQFGPVPGSVLRI